MTDDGDVAARQLALLTLRQRVQDLVSGCAQVGIAVEELLGKLIVHAMLPAQGPDLRDPLTLLCHGLTGRRLGVTVATASGYRRWVGVVTFPTAALLSTAILGAVAIAPGGGIVSTLASSLIVPSLGFRRFDTGLECRA